MENSGHQFFFQESEEEKAFGAAMLTFQLTNRIKYKNTDYLYSFMVAENCH